MPTAEKNAAAMYAQSILEVLDKLRTTQAEAIQSAADLIADGLIQGGILRTFGCGHSGLIAGDLVYRSGGLAPVDMLAEHGLAGHTEVLKSEFLERLEGYAKIVLDYHDIRPPDVLLVISNSGRNAAPIEMAVEAKARGIRVVAITSLDYSQKTTSRHSSGKKLYQVADVTIDNCCPLGDALVELEGLDFPVIPGSGVAGLFAGQSLIAQVVANMLQRGVTPPVFISGNLDGGTERNRVLVDKYRASIYAW
jgi:uncharacterized phosphosugar-binding protein